MSGEMLKPWTARFLELAHRVEALRFGAFMLKSGRQSPYFFNAGQFSTGSAIATLSSCYAEAILADPTPFDMLYGPAYKGIPLVTAIAVSFARDHGIDVPFAYNRKEAKDHGEGGHLVGAPLRGRVLIVDDVISAGTSIRESIDLIESGGAIAAGIAIALDRQERGRDERSAADAIRADGLAVISIAALDDLVTWLDERGANKPLEAMIGYRNRYGA